MDRKQIPPNPTDWPACPYPPPRRSREKHLSRAEPEQSTTDSKFKPNSGDEMKRTAVMGVPSDTEEENDEEEEEEEDESEEERRRDEEKSKLILDSLNPDLRERALRMLRQIEAGALGRRGGDVSNEESRTSDDLRINPWNQVEVFAPVVAAAWHSKAARKSATAWQCIPVIPHAYARAERHSRQSQSRQSGSNVRQREGLSLGSSGQPRVNEAPPSFVSERSQRSSRPGPSSSNTEGRRGQRSEGSQERNVRGVSQLFVSEDNTKGLQERNPRKKIKSTEQALREAREILKKREADRKKAAENDAFEATLFRANAPPPKLFAAPSKFREQGFEEIARRERGLVDRTFDPNLTNPIDRHQRTINRTNTLSSWGSERKVPTWEERMEYLRRQSPPRSRRPTVEVEDDGFDIGRAETPLVDPYRGQHSEGVRIQDSSPFQTNNSRSQSERRLFGRDSEERVNSGYRSLRTQAERQQQQMQPPPQAPTRSAPPAPRPNPLQRGPGENVGTRPLDTLAPPIPASVPRADWRNSEWMAQYQAQAEDDPFAKFYGN